MLDFSANQKFSEVSLMQGKEQASLLHKAALSDAEARLQLVKEHLNLVVELAAEYSAKTGNPFPQMVKAGTMAVIKAVDDFRCSQQVEFSDHVIFHVTKAMEEVNYV